MDPLLLARLQFAVTTVYHFFFVPLTLGLSLLVAIMETLYVKTGNEAYKRMTKFWGTLFLINFAMGVVTGIVQEFQFGMNWSEYSRFVGDIFGAPLAIEALLAFFLESTFLGVWIFGWNRLSPKLHAATFWIVAFGSNLSALWILIANSFMQQPVGYAIRNGRAEMTDFFALITNGHVWVQFPHVFFAGVCTAAFFVIGISAYHLMKKSDDKFVWTQSMKIGTIYGAIGVFMVMMVGHSQSQYMIRIQPMKMAAAEALWDSEDPAAMSLFTIGDEKNREDVFAIKVPGLLSFLAYNTFSGEVRGINQIQKEYEESHGPGNYVPPVAVSYWTFRLMVGAGMVMLLIIGWLLYSLFRDKFEFKPWLWKIIMLSIALPYIANSTGWIFTEMARQPWIVFGVLQTKDAVSPTVGAGAILLSLILFTLVYGALMVADIYLLKKYAVAGTTNLDHHE
jgi:cytochrome d ubiquinol oxidase subunit I